MCQVIKKHSAHSRHWVDERILGKLFRKKGVLFLLAASKQNEDVLKKLFSVDVNTVPFSYKGF